MITPGATVKSLEARAHVGAFLRAAARIGVAPHNLFKPKDLMKRANDRRVMRTLLYLSLALMKYGVRPPDCLHSKVLTLCSSTGYAVPEVLQGTGHGLGRFGIGYVRPATAVPARELTPISPAPTDAGTAAVAAVDPARMQEATAAVTASERRRREMEANSAEFRPQLHFLGTGGRKKRPQPASAATDNPIGANPSAARMHGGRDGLPVHYDPALLLPDSAAADSAARLGSPDLLRARSTAANDGLSNAHFLAHDASGFPIPSFPHPHAERFEAALQNLDLSSLLQAASDETDIDKPSMASLLFPAFDGASADSSSKHGAWNRQQADLHVRVDPIKFAMFTSRHPTLSFAAIWTVFFVSILLLFAPYPKPFHIDLSTSSFHAADDPYTHSSDMFKASVQNSWQYVQMPISNIVLQNQAEVTTQQARDEERRDRLASMMRSRHEAAGPSRFSLDSLAALLSDLRAHHADVMSLSHEAALASSSHDATAPQSNSSASEHLVHQLLHAAADGFDFDARWKARHVEMQSRIRHAETGAEGEQDLPRRDARSSASRSLFSSYDPTLARRSKLGTTISVLYVHTAGSNLLTQRGLNLIHSFEVFLTQPSPYGFFCLLPASSSTGLQASLDSPTLNAATGRYASCEFPDSLLNYFASRVDMLNGLVYMDGANSTNFQNLTTIKALMQRWGRRGFIDRGWESAEAQSDPSLLQSAHTLTTLSFGAPLPWQVDSMDTSAWSVDYQLGWLQNKILDEYIGRVNGVELGDGEIALAIDGPGVQLRILQSIIYHHDLLLIVGSVFAVVAYMLLHLRSVFLVLGSMLQIFFAFFIAAFFYRVVFQIDELNILHILCLFVVLALGTNDAFVLWDTFWHSSLLRLRVELPLDRALRKKRQEEAAFAARQGDRTCRGACARWWYDDSGLYTVWRSLKSHIPCFTVTDLDLAQHFETGIAHSNPLAPRPMASVAELIGNGRSAPGVLSSFVGGGAASPNPLAKNRTAATAQSPPGKQMGAKPAHGRAASHSDTPTRTRLERDSDEETHSALYGDSVAGASPNQRSHNHRSHHRLGSQEFNPPAPLPNEEHLDSSDPGRGPRRPPPGRASSRDMRDEHEAALASDEVSPPFANTPRLPMSSGRNNTVVLHTDNTDSSAPPVCASPLSAPLPVSPTGFGQPAGSPTASLSHHSVGAPRHGFVSGSGSSSGPEHLTPEELERRRNLKVLAAIQNMDGLEDDEDTADLEAMASRNGGLRSAILRKQADRLALRLSWTYRRAAPAMFVTNGTIIVALYAIALSSVVPIKHFGVMMGTLALVNFALSLTMFPTLLVLQYFYLRHVRIVPKACWDWIKAAGAAVQSKIDAGDEKYDRALDLDPTAANQLEGDLSGGARPLPDESPTHLHANKPAVGFVGTGTLSPSQCVNIRSISRGGDLAPSGDPDEEPALRHIRGGVNITKENEETKQDLMQALRSTEPLGPPVGRINPAAVGVESPAFLPPPRPKEGQLVKRRLDASVLKDAERAKANANLEKSRRNQFILFLNSVLFRFRYLCLFIWLLILALAMSQAVQLTIPQRIITILPPSSNLERLRSAYAQLPACQGCTYEFDRVEHQIVPWASNFPISNVEADANTIDSSAMGGTATISAMSRSHSMQTLRKETEAAQRRLLQLSEFALPSEHETREATLELPTHLIEEHNRRPLVWKPLQPDFAAARTSGPTFVHAARRQQHATRSLLLDPSESATGTTDFLSRSLLAPSAPPLFSIASVGYASVRVVFAQSLFAGLAPIESYTLTLVPIRSIAPTATTFSLTAPACQTNAGSVVSKVSVQLRPALAQADLSPVAACAVNVTDVTSCSARPLSDGSLLNAVTLAADWFSTATIVGGQSFAGITHFVSGGLVQDLRGFEHATHYEASIVARSSVGDSPSSTVKSFSTLNGTPFAPIIRNVSIAMSASPHVDAAGNQNPQFTLSLDFYLNYQSMIPALPLPSKVTVAWKADPTFPNAAASGALPADGSSESLEVDVTAQTAACSTNLNCTIALAPFQSTQIRGGQRLLVWLSSTNAHNSSVSSSPLVLMAPSIRPFAPVLVGFTFLSSAPFLSPVLRVYFQQPSSNEGPTSTPTQLQLLYNENVGDQTTAVQQSSALRPWSNATLATSSTDTPIATLNLVLPVASAPLYQLDFAASDLGASHPIAPNSVLQIRLQSRNIVGTSELSNVLIVQSRSATVGTPTFTGLVWASNSLTVSWQPPVPDPNDPSPSYTFKVMLSAASPAYAPSTLTSYPRVSPVKTSSPFTFNGGVMLSEYYYVSIVAMTSYGTSVLAPAQCILIIAGSHPLGSGTLGNCAPERPWNSFCLNSYDQSSGNCASANPPLRPPLVDHMLVYAEPPWGSPTRQNLTTVRRFWLFNGGMTTPLLLESVTALPLQPMQTFASPFSSSVKCLDGGYGEFNGAIPATCYAPCFTQSCASLCGSVSFSIDVNLVPGRAWNSSQYGASTIPLGVAIPGDGSTQFVVSVRPDPDLAPGLYSCGFNFKAKMVDINGVVTSTLGTAAPGVELSEVTTPVDLVLSLRVLPLRKPAPVRTIEYNAVGVDAKNISFVVPYAPPDQPICLFELRTTDIATATNRTLYLDAPTAADGSTISALLPGAAGEQIFSVRAFSASGALDFESETWTADCSSTAQIPANPYADLDVTVDGLHGCSSIGSCRTPMHMFRFQSVGVSVLGSDTAPKIYPILSSSLKFDVMNTETQPQAGVSLCRCPASTFGVSCANACPSSVPRMLDIDGLPIAVPATFDSTCSGRGTCSPSNHNCTCTLGYGGDACETACPSACNGRGTCGADPWAPQGARCFCRDGWGGPACADECPNRCSGHGVCGPFSVCECDTQWRGPSCANRCPGSYLTSTGVPQVCNGRGVCSATEYPVCVCNNPNDSSYDCSMRVGGLSSVHYSLPAAPNLPAFMLPTIHVTWGVVGVSNSDNVGGVSSAADTGADGGTFVSVSDSISAGTPLYSPSFDLTNTDAQVFLRAVCDVIFGSGLISESASSCIMTGLDSYNSIPSNPGATGSFPIASSSFTRTLIYFLSGLSGSKQVWRQHVGFLFSTNPFPARNSAGRAGTMPSFKHPTMFEQEARQAAEFQAASDAQKEGWAASFLRRFRSDATEQDAAPASVYLNFFQLDYLLRHPAHGSEFVVRFHGEPDESAAAETLSSGSPGGRTLAGSINFHVRLCSLSMQFVGTFDPVATSAQDQLQFAEAWTDLLDTHINPVAPASAGGAFHSSDAWTKMSQQLAFSKGVTGGFVLMFVFIFLFVLVSTGGNLRLACLILFVILCLLVLLFGLLVNDSRLLGVVEYCASQIVMALSVHFLLYIGHAYSISPFQTRFGRTRHGLLEWGASIFSAGVSMTLSSFVLVFATIQVLSSMGEILCQMSIVIMLFAITFYIPLLQCLGPVGSDARQAEDKKKKLAEASSTAAAAVPHKRSGSAIQDFVAQHERTTSSPDFVQPEAAALTPSSAAKAKSQRALEREQRTAALAAAAATKVATQRTPSLRGGGGFTRPATESPTTTAPSPPAPVIEETPTNLLSSLDLLPASRVTAPPAKHTRTSASPKVPNPHSRIGLGSMTELTSMTPIDRRHNPETGEMQLSSEEDEGETIDQNRRTRPRPRKAQQAAPSAAFVSTRTDAPLHTTESESARLTPMRDWAPVLSSVETRPKRASGGLPPVVGLTNNSGEAAASIASPSRALPPLDNKLFSDTSNASLRPQQPRDGQGSVDSSAAVFASTPVSAPSDSPLPDLGQSSPDNSDTVAADHSWDAAVGQALASPPSKSGKKKKPRAQHPRSGDMLALDAAAAQNDLAAAPSTSPPAVVLHAAPAASPVLRPPSTLRVPSVVASPLPLAPAPSAGSTSPLSPSSPVAVASEWDRDDAAAVPSRMALSRAPLGKASLPPVALLSRPGSLSPAAPMPPLAVSAPLKTLGSSKLPLPKLHAKPAAPMMQSSALVQLAPLGPVSTLPPSAIAAAPVAAATPLSRPVSLRLPSSKAAPAEDDDLDLDIDEVATRQPNAAASAGATSTTQRVAPTGDDAAVEIDHGSWDD